MPSFAFIRRRVVPAACVVVTLIVGTATVSRGDERVPCDPRPSHASPDAGWRVQVDPETGIYSMPAPAAFAASADARERELVIVPGSSPAGGYKIQLDGGAVASPAEQQ